MIVDLSDRIAGLRSQRAGDARTVRFADQDWTLPALLPMAVTRYWQAFWNSEATPTEIGARLEVALQALFGDQIDAFYALGLAPPDCQSVVTYLISDAYGSSESPGNSDGSSEPSETKPASGDSSSTSSGPGRSTSPKRSRAKKSTG